MRLSVPLQMSRHLISFGGLEFLRCCEERKQGEREKFLRPVGGKEPDKSPAESLSFLPD